MLPATKAAIELKEEDEKKKLSGNKRVDRKRVDKKGPRPKLEDRGDIGKKSYLMDS